MGAAAATTASGIAMSSAGNNARDFPETWGQPDSNGGAGHEGLSGSGLTAAVTSVTMPAEAGATAPSAGMCKYSR
jgi:hypothetical protein